MIGLGVLPSVAMTRGFFMLERRYLMGEKVENLLSIDTTKGWLGDEFKEIKLNINLLAQEIIRLLPKDQKIDFLHDIGIFEDVSECVIDRLAGIKEGYEQYDFDQDARLKLLEKYSAYKLFYGEFNLTIKSCLEKIKGIRASEVLYWKLYHHGIYGDTFRSWIIQDKSLEISQYNEFEDEKYNEILKIIDELKIKSNKMLDLYLQEPNPSELIKE
jgi:hypothetical protein